MELAQRNGLYGFEYVAEDGRRAAPEERKTYQITQLWQRSHEIINLAAQGFKNSEIAVILNITPATVSNTLNSKIGMEKLSDIRFSRDEEVRRTSEKIRVLTERALDIYHNVLEDNQGRYTDKMKKDVADTVVLELSGLRVPTKVQSHSVSTVLTKQELEEFKERGLAAARESGMIVEVEGEDVKSAETAE